MTSKYQRYRVSRSSLPEDEYVYKVVLPRCNQFVVSLASPDDDSHFRFLQHLFDEYRIETQGRCLDGSIILPSRPKLYPYYGLARELSIDGKRTNVTTFPCTMGGPLSRRLGLFKYCSFAIVVFSILDVNSFQQLFESWIFEERHKFKATQIVLIGFDAEFRLSDPARIKQVTRKGSMEWNADTLQCVFEYLNEANCRSSSQKSSDYGSMEGLVLKQSNTFKSFVTQDMIQKMCAKYGVEHYYECASSESHVAQIMKHILSTLRCDKRGFLSKVEPGAMHGPCSCVIL